MKASAPWANLALPDRIQQARNVTSLSPSDFEALHPLCGASHSIGHDDIPGYAGKQLIQVFESPLGQVGILIWAETGGESGSAATLRGARLAAAGADLIVTCSAWWTSAAGLYDLATCTNALRAARWHVIAEQVGRIGYAQYYGHGRIVDP